MEATEPYMQQMIKKAALEVDLKKLYGVVTGKALTGEIFRAEYDI